MKVKIIKNNGPATVPDLVGKVFEVHHIDGKRWIHYAIKGGYERYPLDDFDAYPVRDDAAPRYGLWKTSATPPDNQLTLEKFTEGLDKIIEEAKTYWHNEINKFFYTNLSSANKEPKPLICDRCKKEVQRPHFMAKGIVCLECHSRKSFFIRLWNWLYEKLR
jgi:hypothetical protein